MNNEVMNMKNKILILCGMLVCMLLIVPGVSALQTGTAAVSGNPVSTISLEVTGTHSFGTAMIVGDNFNTTANTVNATVLSNLPWTITVKDALSDTKPVGTDGKMAEWDGTSSYAGGHVLATPFQMSGDGSTYYNLPAAASPQTLFSGVTAGTYYNYPYFKQTVVIADQRLTATDHVYRTVVTFDAATA